MKKRSFVFLNAARVLRALIQDFADIGESDMLSSTQELCKKMMDRMQVIQTETDAELKRLLASLPNHIKDQMFLDDPMSKEVPGQNADGWFVIPPRSNQEKDKGHSSDE
jgi:hypothetical protein